MRSREQINKYENFTFEIWYSYERGAYVALGKGEIKNEIAVRYFQKLEDAVEHAQHEIDGFLNK